jgi:hypothetical protein
MILDKLEYDYVYVFEYNEYIPYNEYTKKGKKHFDK